jgi:hypothetical protein
MNEVATTEEEQKEESNTHDCTTNTTTTTTAIITEAPKCEVETTSEETLNSKRNHSQT